MPQNDATANTGKAGEQQKPGERFFLTSTDGVVIEPPEAEGEIDESVEPGFTGTVTDSLGREYHYVDGKRVPRAKLDSVAPAGTPSETDAATGDTHQQANRATKKARKPFRFTELVKLRHDPHVLASQLKHELTSRGFLVERIKSFGSAYLTVRMPDGDNEVLLEKVRISDHEKLSDKHSAPSHEIITVRRAEEVHQAANDIIAEAENNRRDFLASLSPEQREQRAQLEAIKQEKAKQQERAHEEWKRLRDDWVRANPPPIHPYDVSDLDAKKAAAHAYNKWVAARDAAVGEFPPQGEGAIDESVEPGFTGTVTDSLGREYHYVDGKRVPRAKLDAVAPAGTPNETDTSADTRRKDESPKRDQHKTTPTKAASLPHGGFDGPGGRDEFVRFGDNPPDKVSINNIADTPEDGVSGFRVHEDEHGPYILAGDTDMGPLMERPVYLIKSVEVGTGADGEPLFDGHIAKAIARLKITKDGRKYRFQEYPIDA